MYFCNKIRKDTASGLMECLRDYCKIQKPFMSYRCDLNGNEIVIIRQKAYFKRTTIYFCDDSVERAWMALPLFLPYHGMMAETWYDKKTRRIIGISEGAVRRKAIEVLKSEKKRIKTLLKRESRKKIKKWFSLHHLKFLMMLGFMAATMFILPIMLSLIVFTLAVVLTFLFLEEGCL